MSKKLDLVLLIMKKWMRLNWNEVEYLENYDINEIYCIEEAIYIYGKITFIKKINNGTIQKNGCKGKVKKMFPMFNFDGCISLLFQRECRILCAGESGGHKETGT